uniref:C2orf72-like C-terminal domain-containing protein n=1 Tax=Chrysemys picta bellii TaxID=8478 RepID=A0A8C3HVJ6_CHRPI
MEHYFQLMAMEGESPGPGEQALQEFQTLVELVGGKPEVLLVGEVLEGGETRALLGAFAQDEGTPGERPGDQVRVCLGPGGAGREIRSPLIFLLCRAGSLQPRRARARLREIARDLRSRLPRGPPAALVGVIVQPGPGEEEEAAALLEALLGEVFQEHRAGLQDTVQAAAYSPGRLDGTLEVRRAACRALRAALQHRAGTGAGRHHAWGVGFFLASGCHLLPHSPVCVSTGWHPGGLILPVPTSPQPLADDTVGQPPMAGRRWVSLDTQQYLGGGKGNKRPWDLQGDCGSLSWNWASAPEPTLRSFSERPGNDPMPMAQLSLLGHWFRRNSATCIAPDAPVLRYPGGFPGPILTHPDCSVLRSDGITAQDRTASINVL